MTDLHLIISQPPPGEWHGRLDVVEALEAAGWTGDTDMPLSILRHPSGAVWAVHNESDDSGLDCPNGAVVEFPGDTPAVVIVAACLAAAADSTARAAARQAAGQPAAPRAALGVTFEQALAGTAALGADMRAAQPPGAVFSAAGQPAADQRAALPLATPCASCAHTLNWHTPGKRCQVTAGENRCGCKAFVTPAAGLAAPTNRDTETEQLVHVGWWCWRGDNHGHLTTQACRSDNVPIHVPTEWADDMRTVIQRIEDGDDTTAGAES